MGEFARTKNGFELNYDFSGDGCMLLFDGRTLTHKKAGEIPVRIDFREGETTRCTIGDGALFGEMDVVTRTMKIYDGGMEVAVKVEYLLGEERKDIDICITL